MSSSAAKLEAPNLGFTTEEALKRLYDDIEDVLIRSEYKFFNERYFCIYNMELYCFFFFSMQKRKKKTPNTHMFFFSLYFFFCCFEKRSYIEKVKCSITKPYENPLGWFQLLIAFFSIIILYVINYYFSATFLLILFVITFYIVIRENSIRRTEIHRKIRQILNDISLAKTLSKDWIPENYPNLCCPLSPCVTLQWTYRDGRIVNLPWALLVRGDYIVIRPGQIAPGLCSEVNGLHKFKCGETYGLSQVSKQVRTRL